MRKAEDIEIGLRLIKRRQPRYTEILEAENEINKEEVKDLKIYVAGPMRGYPEFNFPAFHTAAAKLRAEGHIVFSPAEKDEQVHGTEFSKKYPTGSLEDATAGGFSLRRALGDDLSWICGEAEGIYLLRGWESSRGALAEKATSEALGLEVMYE